MVSLSQAEITFRRTANDFPPLLVYEEGGGTVLDSLPFRCTCASGAAAAERICWVAHYDIPGVMRAEVTHIEVIEVACVVKVSRGSLSNAEIALGTRMGEEKHIVEFSSPISGGDNSDHMVLGIHMV